MNVSIALGVRHAPCTGGQQRVCTAPLAPPSASLRAAPRRAAGGLGGYAVLVIEAVLEGHAERSRGVEDEISTEIPVARPLSRVRGRSPGLSRRLRSTWFSVLMRRAERAAMITDPS